MGCFPTLSITLGLALASKSSGTICRLPRITARCSGVKCLRLGKSTSASCSSSTFAHSAYPKFVARKSGVSRISSYASTSAPALNSLATTFGKSNRQLICNGVTLRLLRMVGSAPNLKNSSRTATSQQFHLLLDWDLTAMSFVIWHAACRNQQVRRINQCGLFPQESRNDTWVRNPNRLEESSGRSQALNKKVQYLAFHNLM